MKYQSKPLRSDLVAVEAHTWFVDGVLSASILLGFAIAYGIEQTRFAEYASFIDPVLLIILGLAILPVPFKIMLDSLKEVINKAPPESVTAVIEKRLKQTLIAVPYQHVEVRISKSGRDIYLLVHIIVDKSFSVATISELDDIRIASETAMRQWDPAIIMDILFIANPALAD
jgi:predicted Co/Zn/Cd cation transporter (cation efflux family)